MFKKKSSPRVFLMGSVRIKTKMEGGEENMLQTHELFVTWP